MLTAGLDRSKWSLLTDRLSVNAADVGRLVLRVLPVVLGLAAIQLVLYPVLLGNTVTSWLSFWIYLFAGVILPGTLLVVYWMPWRTDWLTWLGIGWAAGHALELVSFQLAKAVGVSPLFIAWAGVVYGLALFGQRSWQDKITPVAKARAVFGFLALVLLVGTAHFFLLNLTELSRQPPYFSDVWFHINNAWQFRDQLHFQDPRLFGEPMNYHVFGYAPSAAASLLTGSSVAVVLAQYSGLSFVFLVSLLLLNIGRTLFQQRPIVGAICALLVVFPQDVPALFSVRLGFGTSITLYGMYLSTTALVGYAYFAALLLPLHWLYEHKQRFWRTGLLVGLLAFAGAGTKSMIGPLLVSGAVAVVAWRLVASRRLDRHSMMVLVLIVASVALPAINLILGDNSYSNSAEFGFADAATTRAYYRTFTRLLENRVDSTLLETILRAIWIVGFAFLHLVGTLAALWKRRRQPMSSYVIFIVSMGVAATIGGLLVVLSGTSQLIFLYYGMLAVALVASDGLVDLAKRVFSQRRLTVIVAALAIGGVVLAQTRFPRTFNLLNRTAASMFDLRYVDRWSEGSEAVDDESVVDPKSVDLNTLYRSRMRFNDEIAAGLEWARLNLPDSAVFAVNVYNASPYAGLSEQQAFFETPLYHVVSHQARNREDERLQEAYFHEQQALLERLEAGEPDVLARMRAAGITHLYIDRVNGYSVADLPGLPAPVYDSADFSIYDLSTIAPGG